MILSEYDRSVYFPSVRLEGDELIGAMRRAQLLAESVQGAQRSLEIQSYEDTKLINIETQSVQLTYVPIALTPTPTIKAREIQSTDGFGRSTISPIFTNIPAISYELDLTTGHLIFTSGGYSEIKAVYNSGFDFSLESSHTSDIKFAVGMLLQYIESLPGKGVSGYRPAGVEYVNSFGEIPDYLFHPFKKYRPLMF